MDAIVPFFVVSMSFLNPSGMFFSDVSNSYFVVDVEVGAEMFGFLEVYGEVETYMDGMTSEHYFAPFQAMYYFGVAVNIDRFSFGYEHLCRHGIDSLSTRLRYGGGYDKLFIRFSTRE